MSNGVAIPNLKLKSLRIPLTLLTILDKAVPFHPEGTQTADIICTVLSPEHYGPLHLRKLSRLSRMFKGKELCNRIRDAKDADTIRSLLHSPEGWMVAA